MGYDYDNAAAYDGLNRLRYYRRGYITDDVGDSDEKEITSGATLTRYHDLSLDQVGNWGLFFEDDNGNGTADLLQIRKNNVANEIYDGTPGNAITEYVGASWIDPTYDANGNMTLAPRPGDEHTDTEGLVCKYDAWNRLVEVTKDDEGPPRVAKYRYDGQNQRIAKLTPNGESNWDRTDYYYNAAWQVVEERTISNQASELTVATQPTFQYVWSLQYIDKPILRDENKDPGSDDTCDDGDPDERLYYTCDPWFKITALIETDGTVAERYAYNPYGETTFLTGAWALVGGTGAASAYANEILYAGYRHDPETGLYLARRRYHHPTLGRWTTRDPIGYDDGMSLYEYVGSGPIVLTDPQGLFLGLEGSSGPRVGTADWVWTGKKSIVIKTAYCCPDKVTMIHEAAKRAYNALSDVSVALYSYIKVRPWTPAHNEPFQSFLLCTRERRSRSRRCLGSSGAIP